MLENFTIGQFYPKNSLVHKLDPRTKIILTVLFIVFLLFFSNSIFSLLIPLFFIIIAYIVSKIELRLVLKSIKPLIPIIIITGLLNLFLYGGEPIWSWWIFKITYQGIYMSIMLASRILILIVGSSLLTYTTSPIALTDGIENLLSPLKVIKLPVHELAMMMTIALRFIPTLIEETGKIIDAQKARGGDFESGNLIKRARALIPILVPMLISAFRRASDLAIAMESRCYRGDVGRTKLNVLSYKRRDIITIVISVIFLSLTAFISILF